jgi:hypothetical protein
MLKIIRKSATMGALSRRFERDRVFQSSETISGPGATPAGNNNADLALKFGTYPAVKPPAFKSVGRIEFLWGATAAAWANLSDMDGNFAVFGRRFAIKW